MTEQSNRIRIFLFFMLKTSFIRFSNEYTEGQIKKLPGNRKQIKCIIAEIACPAPKWKMCNQVSRLGFNLQSAFPPIAVALCSFVSFTVIGIARKSHPNSLGALTAPALSCNYTRYIHLWLYNTSILQTCQRSSTPGLCQVNVGKYFPFLFPVV